MRRTSTCDDFATGAKTDRRTRKTAISIDVDLENKVRANENIANLFLRS
jgi:hypothetical protein